MNIHNIQRKPTFLSKINESFKLKFVICIILSFSVIIGFFIFNKTYDSKKIYKNTIVDNPKLINSIDQITIKENRIIISGFAFMLDRNSTDSSISVFLRNDDSKKEIWLDMEQIARADINAYFDSEYDYGNSGFIASTYVGEINQEDIYEVIVNIDYNETSSKERTRTTVSARKYLINNELYEYNPKVFIQPDGNIESELLREVFAEGQLCLYNKDAGMYIYQYKGKLYWVVTNDYKFENANHIIYQLYTSQANKLPEGRIKHKFDNLNFDFEQHEFLNENTSPYRVAIRDIPQNYPIIYIKTGVYDKVNKKTIWTKSFHLDNIINAE